MGHSMAALYLVSDYEKIVRKGQRRMTNEQTIQRLTARSPKNNMAYLVNVKKNEQDLEGSYNTLLCVRDAFEALAKYEETGLSPDDIENLKTASKEALGILRDMVDAANVTGSAYLYRRDVENVLRVIKGLIAESEGNPE